MKYVDEYGEVHDVDYNNLKKEFYDKNFDLFPEQVAFRSSVPDKIHAREQPGGTGYG